ncbi:TPA: hypothetical protein SFZ56_000816 [Campylobacter coli]|nr:hypothetical protein [Campylobacter coli]
MMIQKSHSKIGIDVGAKGALAHITKDEIITVLRFNKVGLKGYIDYLKSIDYPVDIYVEKVHSMPNQGVKSMFTFGMRYGEILGILDTLELRYMQVPANYWQQVILNNENLSNIHISLKTLNSLNKNVNSTKLSVAEVVQLLYPLQTNLYYTKRNTPNLDITDSIGIAIYGLVSKHLN